MPVHITLVSCQCIPNLMIFWSSLFLASSWFPTSTPIPDLMLFNLLSFVSSLLLTFHQSCDCGWAKPDCIPPSLDTSQSVLSSLSIYLFPLLSVVHSLYLIIHYPLLVSSVPHHSLPSAHCLCLILSSPSLSTLVSSIFIVSFHWPYLSYPILSLQPIPDRSDHPDPYYTHACVNTLVTSCCSPVW